MREAAERVARGGPTRVAVELRQVLRQIAEIQEPIDLAQ